MFFDSTLYLGNKNNIIKLINILFWFDFRDSFNLFSVYLD